MSTPSTIERSERLTLADMVVVDADVHVNVTWSFNDQGEASDFFTRASICATG